MTRILRERRGGGIPRALLCFLLSPGIFLCALLGYGSINAFGQSSEPVYISPDIAVEIAIRNNLGLESSRVALDTKKRASDLVWNQFIPSVSLSGTLSRDNWASSSQGMVPVPLNSLFPGLPPGTPDIYGVTTYSITLPQWHVLGSISAGLTLNFALFAGIEAVRMDYQTGLVNYEKAKLQIERDIRKSYNQILLLEANAALFMETFANSERQAAVAEANYRAGLAPRLTWLQAQVAVENLKPTLDEMENGIKALKGSFAMNLGLPYNTVFEFEEFDGEDFYIPLDVAEMISKAASGKPDILELQRTIAQLQQRRKATALQLYTPNIIFNWGVNSTFIADPFKDSWFDADRWRKGGNFSVTLGMSLNTLLPFTKEGQALKDLDNTISSLNIGLAQAIHGTELEIFSKINSLEKTRVSTEVQKAAIELAELSYSLTMEAYRGGLQDFQAVQSAALALDQAKHQLLTQKFNYLNDLIDLEYAVGVPFGTLSNMGRVQ